MCPKMSAEKMASCTVWSFSHNLEHYVTADECDSLVV